MISQKSLNTYGDGYLLWDDSSEGYRGLQSNQILLRENTDYFKKDQLGNLDVDSFSNPIFDPELAIWDINRIIAIDRLLYKILSIKYCSGEIVIILDRELEPMRRGMAS